MYEVLRHCALPVPSGSLKICAPCQALKYQMNGLGIQDLSACGGLLSGCMKDLEV